MTRGPDPVTDWGVHPGRVFDGGRAAVDHPARDDRGPFVDRARVMRVRSVTDGHDDPYGASLPKAKSPQSHPPTSPRRGAPGSLAAVRAYLAVVFGGGFDVAELTIIAAVWVPAFAFAVFVRWWPREWLELWRTLPR